jgi:hypothetical protein
MWQLLKEVGVPNSVKVRSVVFLLAICFLRLTTKKCNWQAVSASVIIRGGVQRLMEVADEMNYKSQCVSPRLGARIVIVEHGNL